MNTLHRTFTYSELLDILTKMLINGKLDRKTLEIILHELKSHVKDTPTQSQYNILENVRRDSFD